MRYEVSTRPEGPETPPSITTPSDVHDLLGPEMSGLAQEQMRVLLDIRNNVLGQRVIYQGNVSAPRHAAWDTRFSREELGESSWANRPTLKRKPKGTIACRSSGYGLKAL